MCGFIKKILLTSLLSLCAGCSISGDNRERIIRRVVNRVHCKIKYEADRVEFWNYPEETRIQKKGDCEDFAFLVEDDLKRVGIESVVVVGKRRKDSKFLHAWNEVLINGELYVIDATEARISRREELPSNEYVYDIGEYEEIINYAIKQYYREKERINRP